MFTQDLKSKNTHEHCVYFLIRKRDFLSDYAIPLVTKRLVTSRETWGNQKKVVAMALNAGLSEPAFEQ